MSTDQLKDEGPMESNNINPTFSLTKEDIDGNPHTITSIVSPYTGHIVEITNNVDQAMAYATEGAKVEWTPEKDRKLIRKIDLIMCPIICLCYATNMMDKVSNGYAAVMGIRQDLDMHGKMFSWVGSAFYFGYILFEFPAGFIVSHFPLAKTLSAFVVIWGFILCMHAVPQYDGLVALRVILGMLESAITPAYVLLTSQWYRKNETYIRTALWYGCTGLGDIMGSAIAYGLYIHRDSYSIKAWKLVFIVTGLITIVVGFILAAIVPDVPVKAWFLTEEEKHLVVERIRINQQGFGNRHFKKQQVWEAMKEYRTFLLFCFGFLSSISNGAITNFGSILLEGMGFSTAKTLKIGIARGAIGMIGNPLLSLASLLPFMPKHRFFWGLIGTLITVLATGLLAYGPTQRSELAGFLLMSFIPAGWIAVLSSNASNIAGTTKKATCNAVFLIGWCTGNIVGPQTFKPNQDPTYPSARMAMLITYCLATATLTLLYASYWYDNVRRDKAKAKLVAEGKYVKVENIEFADLTDKENPEFRYTL